MRSVLVGSVAVVMVVGSIAGCSSTSPVSPDGGSGLGLTVNEQVFIEIDIPDRETLVLLSDRTGLCGLLNSGVLIKSANILSLGLVNVDSASSTAAAIPGVYNLVDTIPGTVGLYLWSGNTGVTSNDANCTGSGSGPVSGTVTLTAVSAVDGGTAVGSYGMSFGLTQVQGNIAATYCNYTYQPLADAGWADGGGTPPCL